MPAIHTGWPIWVISDGFSNLADQPHVHDHTWEQFIVGLSGGWTDTISFMVFDPKGRFYFRREIEDDLGGDGERKPLPLTTLEFGIAILRVAEAIAVGIAYAKAMGCDPEMTTLSFYFGWNRLNGRELSSWANPLRFIRGGGKAYENEVRSYVEVPLNAPLSRLSEFVKTVIDPLFEVFNGFVISQTAVDDMTQRLINRRL